MRTSRGAIDAATQLPAISDQQKVRGRATPTVAGAGSAVGSRVLPGRGVVIIVTGYVVFNAPNRDGPSPAPYWSARDGGKKPIQTRQPIPEQLPRRLAPRLPRKKRTGTPVRVRRLARQWRKSLVKRSRSGFAIACFRSAANTSALRAVLPMNFLSSASTAFRSSTAFVVSSRNWMSIRVPSGAVTSR